MPVHSGRFVVAFISILAAQSAFGQAPPELATVFPPGGKAGQSVDVTLSGGNLQTLKTLHSNLPGVRCEQLDASRFRMSIPPNATPGLYDLWAVGDSGVSAPRSFSVSNRIEYLEAEPNETESAALPVPLDVVINGRIEKPTDVDHYRFDAKRGQRVVVECSAERIDSQLRAVLEIYDASGRRLDESSDDYLLLRDWIAQGSPGPRTDDPQLVRLDLSPQEQVVSTNETLQLTATAFFSNGTSRDVTKFRAADGE